MSALYCRRAAEIEADDMVMIDVANLNISSYIIGSQLVQLAYYNYQNKNKQF